MSSATRTISLGSAPAPARITAVSPSWLSVAPGMGAITSAMRGSASSRAVASSSTSWPRPSVTGPSVLCTTTWMAELALPPKCSGASSRTATDSEPSACQPAPERLASTFGANAPRPTTRSSHTPAVSPSVVGHPHPEAAERSGAVAQAVGIGVGGGTGVAAGGRRRHGGSSFRLGVGGGGRGGSDEGGQGLGGGVARDDQDEPGEGGREPAVSARSAIRAPTTAATEAATVSATTRPQSGVMPLPARTSRATALVSVITTSEVPAAYAIGRLSASRSAGTTRKPPPTPRNPVSRPTTVAVTSTLRARGHWQAKVGLKVMIGSSRAGRWAWRRRRRATAAPLAHRQQHAHGEHQHGERREQHRLRHRRRGARPGHRAAERDDAEGDPAGEHDVARGVRRQAPTSDVTPTTTSDPVVAWAGLCPRA